MQSCAFVRLLVCVQDNSKSVDGSGPNYQGRLGLVWVRENN